MRYCICYDPHWCAPESITVTVRWDTASTEVPIITKSLREYRILPDALVASTSSILFSLIVQMSGCEFLHDLRIGSAEGNRKLKWWSCSATRTWPELGRQMPYSMKLCTSQSSLQLDYLQYYELFCSSDRSGKKPCSQEDSLGNVFHDQLQLWRRHKILGNVLKFEICSTRDSEISLTVNYWRLFLVHPLSILWMKEATYRRYGPLSLGWIDEVGSPSTP